MSAGSRLVTNSLPTASFPSPTITAERPLPATGGMWPGAVARVEPPGLLANSTAAATTIATMTAAAALFANSPGGSTRATAAGHIPPVAGNGRSAVMIGDGNEAVGRLFVTARDPALMMVSVDYPVPSGTYAVQQRTDQGATHRLGEMQVDAGHGTWGGVTADDHNGSIQLVDPTGAVLCETRIPVS